jgi:hypothetical protein
MSASDVSATGEGVHRVSVGDVGELIGCTLEIFVGLLLAVPEVPRVLMVDKGALDVSEEDRMHIHLVVDATGVERLEPSPPRA